MKKLSKAEAGLKKGLLIKKACIYVRSKKIREVFFRV